MALAAPGPLLTPPTSSCPPETPHRSYSAQIQSQNAKRESVLFIGTQFSNLYKKRRTAPPKTVPAPADENMTYTITQTPSDVQSRVVVVCVYYKYMYRKWWTLGAPGWATGI